MLPGEQVLDENVVHLRKVPQLVQVSSLQGANSESGKGHVALEARLEEATAEKQRVAAKLSAVEEDRRSLQMQLQEVLTSLWPAPSRSVCFFSVMRTASNVFCSHN